MFSREISNYPLETKTTPEQIIGSAKMEYSSFKQHPLAGVIAHWGVEMNNDKLLLQLQKNGNHDAIDNPNLTLEVMNGTGFTSRFMYPTGTTMREASYVEREMGQRLLLEACRMRGIEPSDLKAVFVTNSLPGSYEEYPNDYFAEQITYPIGVKRKNTEVWNVSLACGGTGEMFRRIGHRQEEWDGEYVGIGGVEGLTKMVDRTGSDGRLDVRTATTFSNAGGFVVLRVNRDFKIDPGKFIIINDRGSIVAPSGDLYTFEANITPDNHPELFANNYTGEGYMEKNHTIRQRLIPTPDGGRYVKMDEKLTREWVVRDVNPFVEDALIVRAPDPNEDGTRDLIAHQANGTITGNIHHRTYKKGVVYEKHWECSDGNSSSQTLPTALVRMSIKGDLKANRRYKILVFGVAGNGSDCEIHDFQDR